MIHVTTCGFDSNHKKPCNIDYNLASNEYLALFIKKEAWYYLDDTRTETHSNMVIIYPPQSHVHYGCDIPGYNDDWIHFSLKEDDLITEENFFEFFEDISACFPNEEDFEQCLYSISYYYFQK